MTDALLEAWVSALIEVSKFRKQAQVRSQWTPGKKMRLLLMAYNGARNTGEDVRVEEIVRQFRRIFGEENLELSVLTFDSERSRGYFVGASQVDLPFIFPPFLWREVPRYDGVVTAVGAMFQRTFANAATTLMIGAMGMASGHNRLSVAYGVEAGEMDSLVEKMCRRYCGQSLIILRNEESRAALQKLGVQSELGADTAWTFEPLAPEFGRKALGDAGWDGHQTLLAVCPNRPFSWPVRASLFKAAARTFTGAYGDSHYRSIYFHNSGAKAEAAYRHYVKGIATAVERFRRERNAFPILIGMERLDAEACNRISERLGRVPVFTSDQYDMFQLVSILRCCHMLVSSRYHAIVTSMPGLVPSAGVSMDQRIRNLMHERGHPYLLVDVTDPELDEKLFEILEGLRTEKEAVSEAIGRTVVKNIKAMALMGSHLEQYVRRCLPEFQGYRCKSSWEDYVPTLSPNLEKLVKQHEVFVVPTRTFPS
jgi:polysaccharide pyruvyl transferase WcaK-like protein